uniref:Retrotransposon protein, putative, Ty1-copia subclass n=1 Tax=Tanacetum cinerariifolium TaxID=118510 RepID=A0A6L2J4G9_TANCI|nr:retrotransposon protein, putative, Ty1-copia subclass [Tanacetum cinerariifolium]
MLGSMTPELHILFENYSPYEMLQDLKYMFEKQVEVERVTDLLRIIHTDVCGPLRHVSRQGASYFITFTDDYSRYGYVYLLKHKHEVFETFKVFENEVENQLGKIIKIFLSDGAGEYISQEFKYYLKACGIFQQLTPSYTPKHNGAFERINRTLLDMVRSMMNLTTLPLSFWNYALESATRILNMVPTKKVDKTPYELCGRAVDLEEIQDEDTSPFEITSKIPMEVEGFEPPQEEVILICRSERTHRAPNCLCLNVEMEKHSLGDLNEPTSYKAAMLDSKSNKWIDAMNAKIQSMIDNMVWVLVDLPPNCKTVESKIDYEETFSPVAEIRAIKILICLAAYYDYEIWQIDVKTTFSNGYLDEDIYMASGSNVTFFILYVDDIIIMGNHIPSLQSVKDYLGKCFAMKDLEEASFILEIKIYKGRSKRLIGLGQNAYMDKILKRYKIDNSKRGHIPMKERLDLNKTQGASTPKETNRDDTKSQTGFVFILNGGAVDCKSSKQSTTAMSVAEAEYIDALEVAMEVVWIRKFISGLGIVPTTNEPIRIFCDNSVALHFANEPGVQRGATLP